MIPSDDQLQLNIRITSAVQHIIGRCVRRNTERGCKPGWPLASSSHGACWILISRASLADMAAGEKGVERWAALESNPEVLPPPPTPVP